MNVLGILFDSDATANFKGMKYDDLFQQSGLTEAPYRKVIHRLVCSRLIDVSILNRKRSIYITQWGIGAIKTNLEGVSA